MKNRGRFSTSVWFAVGAACLVAALVFAAVFLGWLLGASSSQTSDGMAMVYVPGGMFLMGSDDGHADEQPVHSVTLDSFWIDRTEVSNAQYASCCERQV